MAKMQFLMQGMNAEFNHKKAVEDLLSLENANQIILSTAFLTSEGVYLLREPLQAANDKITAFIGVRNGITSKQGFESLFELGVETYAVDTGSSRFIFHPKAFLSMNSNKAVSIVGSANLTYGGLVNNLESSSVTELDLKNNFDDNQYVQSFINVFAELKANFPENVIKIGSKETIQLLFDEGKLIDESEPKKISNVGRNKKGEEVTPVMLLKREKVSLPAKARKAANNMDRKHQLEQTEILDPATVAILDNKSMELREVWMSKELRERDLNVPTGTTTNVTGSMLLKKGQYDIDQQTYFREDVFKHLNWSNRPGKDSHFEYATAKFHFIIEGINYGEYKLELKHDTRTDTKTYEQRQPMTHLLWGNAKKLIANRNLLEKHLTLFQVLGSADEFLIEIQ
ncbi:phospholipase D family protein [Paenibacillus urinalis]|uniref:Phospholipase D family protein n=1 Tax=Paenibacillus urinalis TaxID=521520 RepID=A0ABY7XBY8_9BACL|nr:phospholipase D family protein [Paenibacillus urinalis]WDH98687.1 phospholipase D family protein [Paenibacillus urinalis]WDI02380.1 phospholipase D family protein [Paenibacillus urinalis]